MTTTKKPAPPKAQPTPRKRTRNRPGVMEGTSWTEEDFVARGYRRVNVRLQKDHAATLARLEKALALPTIEVIRQALDELAKRVLK